MLAVLRHLALRLRIYQDLHGQDLIEYALLLGLLATAGAAFLPPVSDSIQTVFRSVRRVLRTSPYHSHDDD